MTTYLRRHPSLVAWVVMVALVAFLFHRSGVQQDHDRQTTRAVAGLVHALDQEIHDRAVATCVTSNDVRAGIRAGARKLALADGRIGPNEAEALRIFNASLPIRDCSKVN